MVFFVYRLVVNEINMNNIRDVIYQTLRGRRAQILLPAVMLAPIFILIIYLLFETAKLSMTKVRQQFALDNGAYSQMSATSGYLNAVAQVNGPLPYRVMKTLNYPIPKKNTADPAVAKWDKVTIFDMFYASGMVLGGGGAKSGALGVNGTSSNSAPAAKSDDWGFHYYSLPSDDIKYDRSKWEQENPSASPDIEGRYVLTNKALADNYFFGGSGIGLPAIKEYVSVYARTQIIYNSQTYSYKDTTKKSHMFRESYFLNTKDCPQAECGAQAASVLDRFILETKPFEIDDVRFYLTADYQGSTSHSGAYKMDIKISELMKGPKLFQFAYLTPGSRGQLQRLKRGVVLKQRFKAPANRFNINVTERYKPYVRNTVTVSCPRGNNNCVWPNPISKYSVKVGP